MKRLIGLAVIALSTLPIFHGYAQDYPSRPIRIVLPYGPGGGTDILARSFGDYLSTVLPQPVVIDNRPGANGFIAAEAVLRAPADGYTLWFPSESQMAINPHLHRTMPYDAQKDFLAVALCGKSDVLMVVSPQLDAGSVREFIALAKARPGKLNYAFPGPGSPHHLSAERFRLLTSTDIVGVSYQLTPAALLDIAGGRVQMMMVGTGPAIGLVQSGKLKALGTLAEKRLALFPNVPTFKELGIDLEVFSWWGVTAPRGTPPDRIARLEQELLKAARAPEVIARVAKVGIDVAAAGREEFTSLIQRDYVAYGEVIRKIGLEVR